VRKQVLGLFATTAFMGSLPASAASETLDYTSAALTSSWSNGTFLGEVDGSASSFSASLTLSAPLAANLTNVNESSLVTALTFTVDPSSGSVYSLTLTPSQAKGSSFNFTTNSSGVIIGWDFTAGETSASPYVLFHSCNNDSCAAANYAGQYFGATGDWYDYKPGSETASDGCTYEPANGCGTGNGAVGKWVVAAPELDPGSTAAGLTLFAGALMLLQGRGRKHGPTAR
jgi:hypothetical protein